MVVLEILIHVNHETTQDNSETTEISEHKYVHPPTLSSEDTAVSLCSESATYYYYPF